MNPELTKLIEQYLSGELSLEDAQIFEDRMASSDMLRQAVAEQKEIHLGAKRAYQRQQIQTIGKRYHFRKNLLKGGLSILIIGTITATTLFLFNQKQAEDQAEIPTVSIDVRQKLDAQAPMDLASQYFSIPEDGGVVLSEEGILISVPKEAFTLNGSPYNQPLTIQFQEAIAPSDIIQGGLNTTSNGQLLETGGMISLTGYTMDGKALDFNPKVGVYVQVPIEDMRSDMQLYDGEIQADGSINWVKPQELEKIPVPVPMSELNFYPKGYEKYLNKEKWKTSKASRDSLYLSFEEDGCYESWGWEYDDAAREYNGETENMISAPTIRPIYQFADEPLKNNSVNIRPVQIISEDTTEITADSVGAAFSEASIVNNYIYPSNVLAFWNKGFNNTNLATHEFERRMQVIHHTCDNSVLKVYTSNLDKSLKECDEQLVVMGHWQFEQFAAENVGKMEVGNPHVKQLQGFYQKSIKQLKKRNSVLQKQESDRRVKHDAKTKASRNKETQRTLSREKQAFDEEYEYNLNSVYKQLGRTRGFTIRSGSNNYNGVASPSAIKNIDRLVAEATRNRESLTVRENGKTAKIVYNDFTFSVPSADEYIKLFAYVLPYELNSYQRIEGKNGAFSHPLNDAFRYNVAVVGVTESGYELFTKRNIKDGELGQVPMKTVSKTKLDADIKQLNKVRGVQRLRFDQELDWLSQEQKDYKEQKMRKAINAFRDEIREILFPCCNQQQGQQQGQAQAKAPLEGEEEAVNIGI